MVCWTGAGRLEFQSTLPHGERLLLLYWLIGWVNFNPRSRMGSDPTAKGPARTQVHFNPRSRMGSDTVGHALGMVP